MDVESKHLIFVCTGNTCRSPMAELLMRQHVGEDSSWRITSAGISTMDGLAPSEESVKVLEEVGVDLRPHRSTLLTMQLVDAAELLVVMTESHRQIILQSLPEAADKVRLLNSFGTGNDVRDISDPVGCSIEVYRRTRDQIDSALADLILTLREPHGGEESLPQNNSKG